MSTRPNPLVDLRRTWDRLSGAAQSLEIRHPNGVVGVSAVLIPLVLFLFVRPDWFYLQNGIDNFFYVGYSQNLGEIIDHLDKGSQDNFRRYFITRWTLYLPERFLIVLLGNPLVAFLAVRWMGAALIVGAIMLLLRGRCRVTDSIAVSVVVLLLPTTIRGLLTEYGDAVSISLGPLLLLALFRFRVSHRSMLIVGASVAAIGIAYPFALMLGFAAFPVFLWSRRADWRVPHLLTAVASCLFVIAAGYLFFRVAYSIDNVYEPTFKFLAKFGDAPDIDGWKAPNLDWLTRKLWVFLPFIVLGMFWLIRKSSGDQIQRFERDLAIVLGLHYSMHTIDQFLRGGMSWELFHLWSFILPSLIVTAAVVLASIARHSRPGVVPLIAIVLVILASTIRGSFPVMFFHWAIAALACLSVGLLTVLCMKTRPEFVAASFIALVFALQVGSPREQVAQRPGFQSFASLETAYDQDSEGVLSFRLATWFGNFMRTLSTEQRHSSYFYVDNNQSFSQMRYGTEEWTQFNRVVRMTATYGAFVSGRLRSMSRVDGSFSPFNISGQTLVLIGRNSNVTEVVSRLVDPTLDLAVVKTQVVPYLDDTVVAVVSRRGS